MALRKRGSRITRQPSGFQFAIAGRVEFLNTQDWDHVTAGASVFLSREYLSAVENEFADQMIRDYAIIYDAGKPVAAVATQSFDVVGDQLVNVDSQEKPRIGNELKRKSLSLLKRRVLVCGNVHTWGPHGVAFADAQDKQRLWPAVADCLYRIRRSNRLHGQTDYVMIKDLFASDQQPATALQPFRYRSIETEPNMVLTLDPAWETFDDYLGSLTKRYRAAARKVMKPFAAESLRVESVENVLDEADRIHELYHAVADKADVCLFELRPSTLPAIAAGLGDKFATIGIRENGKLIGFVTVVRDGDEAVGYYIGIDYDANESIPIYHRLLLAVIEQAITWKCSRISFGRTALDAKSRLGCKPEDTSVWVRHRVPILNAVVQRVLKNVEHAEPPERNPFKDSGPSSN